MLTREIQREEEGKWCKLLGDAATLADRKTEGGNAGFNRLLYCLPAVVQAMSRFLLLPSYAKAMPSPVLT